MKILEKIKHGLIVSCQALEGEPLHSPFIMGRMAKAAMLGGAAGIRANSPEDIIEIKKEVTLPVIGIIKKVYPDSLIYITPTMGEIDELVNCGCEIIAMDATNRARPNGQTLETLIEIVKKKYPSQLFMADCATYEEGMAAAMAGFDLIGTTLCGYTEESKNDFSPNFHMMSSLARNCGKHVIAEGNIWTTSELQNAMRCGVWAAVIGSAITRPMLITKRFADAIIKALH